MGTMLAVLLALQAVPTDPIVEKGRDYLRSRADELRKDPEFSLWILLSIDAAENDPVVHTLLDDVLKQPPRSTRTAALQAMALEVLDPVKFRVRIAHDAQFLIDNQCDDGRWDAGKPVDPPELPPEPKKQPAPRAFNAPAKPVRPRVALPRRSSGAKTGDSVNSRWAAWGLLACQRSGFDVPADLVEKAAASWMEGKHDPADVVTSLSILRYLGKKDWKKDPDILIALQRLATGEPATDPASLLLLKVGMRHFGSDKLGERDWWQDGVKVLSASQAADGGWGSVEATGCAALFLYVPRLNFRPMPKPR